MRGTIAWPSRSAGAPVAVVLHMRGLPCTDRTEELPCRPGRDARYDAGMAWLLSALAARGWVAVAPDLTATRDFRYEAVNVPLGWQLAETTLTRLRQHPRTLGVPAAVRLSATTVAVGHSVGGDQALWWATARPRLLSAVVQLEPAMYATGLFPPPADPRAFGHGIPQTAHIPPTLPVAVLVGRCDDDAGYNGGDTITALTVDTARTAQAVLAVLPDADHVMLNTRSLRHSDLAQPGCTRATDVHYPARAATTRARVAAWTADTLDVLLRRRAATSPVGQRAGLDPAGPATIHGVPGSTVLLVPAGRSRTDVLLPLGGADGAPQSAAALFDQAAGAASGTTYAIVNGGLQVCPAGGGTDLPDRSRDPCSPEHAERVGTGGAVHLSAGDTSGTWTATTATAFTGTLLATLMPDPARPPSMLVLAAGAEKQSAAQPTTAIGSTGLRGVPQQLRLRITSPAHQVTVTIRRGAGYLSNVVVVSDPTRPRIGRAPGRGRGTAATP